jgi:hypothetical protein
MLLHDYIERALSDLAKSDPQLNVKRVRKILEAMLRAESVEFKGADGKDVHGRTLLQNLLVDRFKLTLSVGYEPKPGDSDHGNGAEEDSPSAPPSPRAVEGAKMQDDPRFVRFVRELDKLERARRFVWIGYLAKEKLPELGFSADEVNHVLDHSAAEGIITLGKVPNPKNPEFPATCVQLNREHPTVQRILGNGRRTDRRFPLGRIDGEPLSATIIRERR